jgi:hypothetical protein
MHRRLVGPARRPQVYPRSGFPPSALTATAPSASLPVDERPFEEDRRAQKGDYLGDVG